jgi:VCBS repeat-containing protein
VQLKDNGGIANGGVDASSSQTFTITVTAVNDAPSFTKGANQTVADNAGPQTVASWATNLSAGPADEAAQTLSFTITSNTNTALFAGQPAMSSNGTLTYTPAVGASGTATVTVRLQDNGGTTNGGVDLSAPQSFTITVTLANTAPTANNDSYTTDEDAPLTVAAATGVLANDSDRENNPLTTVVVSGPAKGTLTLNPNGSFSYTPNANANGSDSFTYRASDGTLQSSPATVSITINPVNDAPTATVESYTTDEDNALTVPAATGVLANDSDVDGDALAAVVVAQPLHGTVSLNANGSFTYTPGANYSGGDSFTYKATDPSSAASAVTTVTITVRAINDAPVLAPIASQSKDEGTPVTFTAAATDVDGNALTYSLVSAPQGASINSATGAFTWTPSEVEGPGSYTFSVHVQDNGTPALADSKSVTITVNEVNVAPLLGSVGNKSVVFGNTLTFKATATDADLPANTLTFSLVNAPAGATIDGTSGDFSWKPNETQQPGTYTLTVRVSDGGLSDDEAITVTVQSPPPPTRMTVALDMVPGSSTNTIGYSTTTDVTFAILSSATFDAAQIDPATVTLGNEQGTDTPLNKTTSGAWKFVMTDVNGDFRPDFYGYVSKAQIKANGDLTLSTTSLTALAGLKAPSTQLVRGTDMVKVVQ